MKLLVAGVDPAFANFGIARMVLNTDTLELEVDDLHLIQTEKLTTKSTRQNSDDLRRAVELRKGFISHISGCKICFAEIPSGSQHSRSALGFGVAMGVLAGSPIPLIEVMPSETKLATVGKKTASKKEMIAWASELYPHAPWLRARGAKNGHLIDDNEHLADACAIAHAGISTPEFRRLIDLWKATS